MKFITFTLLLFSLTTFANENNYQACKSSYFEKAVKRNKLNKTVAVSMGVAGAGVGIAVSGGFGFLYGPVLANFYKQALNATGYADRGLSRNQFHIILDLLRYIDKEDQGLANDFFSQENEAMIDLEDRILKKIRKCSFANEVSRSEITDALRFVKNDLCEIQENSKTKVTNYRKLRKLILEKIQMLYPNEQCL
jgi:hypothetical protein